MMRTPSMTQAEAEAILGARGSTKINTDNLGPFKKWLTSRGVNSRYASGVAVWIANNVYNDVTDGEFAKYREFEAKWLAKQGVNATDKAETTATTQKVESSPAAANDAGEALANLISPHLVGKVIEQVMAAVNKRLESVQIVRIEVCRADTGEINKIEGHAHPKFETLLKAMCSRQANGFHPNIMMCGPTGSGKTHAVEQAAKALGLEFYSNGAISMDHQLIGFIDAAGNYHSTPIRRAFGSPAVYLFDEIDSSDNSPLLCMAGLLANGRYHFPDAYVQRHPDSIIVAAGNTWGHGANSDFVGRNRLDGAIRSRFPVRVMWPYDEDLETAISGNANWAQRVQRARYKAFQAGLKVIIDPRMTQAGAALIAQGFSFDEAAENTYLADLTEDQRKLVA